MVPGYMRTNLSLFRFGRNWRKKRGSGKLRMVVALSGLVERVRSRPLQMSLATTTWLANRQQSLSMPTKALKLNADLLTPNFSA